MLEDVVKIDAAPKFESYLIMGTPGAGKTTISGSFPKPILFIDIDKSSGYTTLENKYPVGDIDFLSINQQANKSVYTQIRSLFKELLEKTTRYKTIVVSTISEIHSDMEKQIMSSKNGTALNFDDRMQISKLMLDIREDIVKLAQKYICVQECHIKYADNTDRVDGKVSKIIIPKMTATNGNNMLETCNAVLYTTKKTIKHDKDEPDTVKFVTYVGAHPNIPGLKIQSVTALKNIGQWVEDLTYDKLQEILSGKAVKSADVIEINDIETDDTNNE